MTFVIKDITIWTKAFDVAMQGVAKVALGGLNVRAISTKAALPEPLYGAFVQVVCSEGAVLLGIAGEKEVCNNLARIMLGMKPRAPITEPDVFDAVGEMMNIASGTMKTQLARNVGDIQLGLPVFLRGRLRALGNIIVESKQVSIGPHRCELIVLALTGS